MYIMSHKVQYNGITYLSIHCTCTCTYMYTVHIKSTCSNMKFAQKWLPVASATSPFRQLRL